MIDQQTRNKLTRAKDLELMSTDTLTGTNRINKRYSDAVRRVETGLITTDEAIKSIRG